MFADWKDTKQVFLFRIIAFLLVVLDRYYANLFLHFEPLGYSYELKQDLQKAAAKTPVELRREQARVAFHKALERQQQMNKPKPKMATAQDVPFYVTPETDQELRWKQDFIFQREPRKPFKPQMTV